MIIPLTRPKFVPGGRVSDKPRRLANEAKVSASTQNQALAALLFLYQQVLGRELAWLGLRRDEVRDLFAHLHGVPLLVAGLLYGGGLRLLEPCN